MFSGIASSVSGLINAVRRTAITANNTANALTPGFQSARADNVEVPGGGVRIGSVTRDPAPGAPLPGPPDAPVALGSNVDIAAEQVDLLLSLRQFEANANALRAQDDTLGTLLDRRE